MSFLSLPDIAGLLVLMAVLAWFRRRHQDERVALWLLGLGFILLQMIAAAIVRAPDTVMVVTRVAALDAYLLAAVAFGWPPWRELLPGASSTPHILLPGAPLLVLTSLLGAGIVAPRIYLFVVAASLILGLGYLLFFARARRLARVTLTLVHLAIWLPMLYLAGTGSAPWVVYWGLACMYLLVAHSFFRRMRPGSIGARLVTLSFVLWALCFLAYPGAGAHRQIDALIVEVWSIQKFFVVIGMLLMLLEDETERRRDEAMHDALTGLPNRRLFDDRLTLALERSLRSSLSTAVFAIDLNGFKEVNDTYGHQAGDVVLQRVADKLKRKIRGADTVARCGGDEFLVIVNDLTRPENCPRIAAGLRASIASITVPGASAAMGGSIGFAVFPEEATDGAALCQLADERMYEDKQAATPNAV